MVIQMLATLSLSQTVLRTLGPVFLSLFIFGGSAFAIETVAREAIVIDMQTGTILLDKNADVRMPPASMSKLMTVYMLFEQLKNGSISLDDTFRVSENAWRKGGAKSGSSTMFLMPGKRVGVEDLIRGIVVQSGNDASIVVAEGLAGSEEAFARNMSAKAQELGMTGSTFANATGWPDPDQRMTARDLALLVRLTIEEFPEYFHYYSEKEFTYNKIRQPNRNPLLYRGIGADGMKTGHTQESGYGLTGTAIRKNRRLILVLNGMKSKKERRKESERLLDWGFREYNNYLLFKAGEEISEIDIWLGQKPSTSLYIDHDVLLTIPRKDRKNMKVRLQYDGPVPAPIKKDQQIGQVIVDLPGRESLVYPLKSSEDVARLGLIGRLVAAFKYIMWGRSG